MAKWIDPFNRSLRRLKFSQICFIFHAKLVTLLFDFFLNVFINKLAPKKTHLQIYSSAPHPKPVFWYLLPPGKFSMDALEKKVG